MIYDCIIIGAGASGLMCASSFKAKNINGLILEGSKKAGTKLLMSGGGHCNITHAGSIKNFPKLYTDHNGKSTESFTRGILYKHSNIKLMDFLSKLGIKCVWGDDERVFPESRDSETILKALIRQSAICGFKIKNNAKVIKIKRNDKADEYLLTANNEEFITRNLVIACGGASYPKTGSNGELLRILTKDLGIETSALTPALIPLKPLEYPYSELSGVSIPCVRISTGSGKKTLHSEGPLLFTHTEFSGPAILNISKHVMLNNMNFRINYIPDYMYDSALETLKKADAKSNASLGNITANCFNLPRSFCHNIAMRSGASLKTLAKLLTSDEFSTRDTGDLNKAMVTSGGVSLTQLNSKTLELKEYPGIYVIGEALDIDGPTGGYNLQFCYSSAASAAESISSHIEK